MPASHAQCNGGTYFPALWHSVQGVLWWLGGWHSVPERASYGTEYACRAKKGFLRYATHFLKPSVLKTGFWGTEGIFGTGNALLRYATRFQRRAEQTSTAPDASSAQKTAFCCTGHIFKGAKQPTPIRPPLNLSNKTISQCATASEIWSKLLKIFIRDQVYHTHRQTQSNNCC